MPHKLRWAPNRPAALQRLFICDVAAFPPCPQPGSPGDVRLTCGSLCPPRPPHSPLFFLPPPRMDQPHGSPGSPPPPSATDETRGGVKRRAAAPPAVRELEGALEVGADALAGLVGAVSSFGVDGQADLFAKVCVVALAALGRGLGSREGVLCGVGEGCCLSWERGAVRRVGGALCGVGEG